MVSATEYQQAVEAFAQENYEEAVKLFTYLVDARPEDPNLRLWLASAQQQIGRPDMARTQYEQVLALKADSEVHQTANKALQRLDLENMEHQKGGNRMAPLGPESFFEASYESVEPTFVQTETELPFAPIDLGPADFLPEEPRETAQQRESIAYENFYLEPFSSPAQPLPDSPEKVTDPYYPEQNYSAQPIELDLSTALSTKSSQEPMKEKMTKEMKEESSYAEMHLPKPMISTTPEDRPSKAFAFNEPLNIEEEILNAADLENAVSRQEKMSKVLLPIALIPGVGSLLGLGWAIHEGLPLAKASYYGVPMLVGTAASLLLLSQTAKKLTDPTKNLMGKMSTFLQEQQQESSRQKQEKEDLQRQVIKLLDEVEGAARGDLTVQAEVTADIMGAVADSFNLTIQNLSQLVRKVKRTAGQVSLSALENEQFARGLSTDALRQSEEIGQTLGAVRNMTKSIQQVASNARTAETVARQASETAAQGGEAVERTVAGILSIRETVSETGKKVKRLAESTQEISKIVALINQLSSRTNLLALNASIEAVRAGEAGRGFAIVADEVRQLADRAAKATREIEQIVLNIQSETSSVMAAMDTGIDQVIQGTAVAQQAKASLDEIITVSRQIDELVSGIAHSSVSQEETARIVAKVMEGVEVTAQTTSEEARRVSDSLQRLVSVSNSLEASTNRFQVTESSQAENTPLLEGSVESALESHGSPFKSLPQ
ncbi:MAG: methyl-accepting chemotaxis protein [Gloeobacterales cyanobacterium]